MHVGLHLVCNEFLYSFGMLYTGTKESEGEAAGDDQSG